MSPPPPPDAAAPPNVLAARYASSVLRELWSPHRRITAERELWTAVLEAQAGLGVPVPEGATEAYRAACDRVDLDSIRARERITRHDLAARLEEFNALAGYQAVHRGLTSRDVTENTEQMLIHRSLGVLRDKTTAVLARLAAGAAEHRDRPLAGRTHNVPAQPVTFGKRLASVAEETLLAHRRLESLLADYPLRGLKGAVGTGQDLLDLLGGDPVKVDALERRIARALGFSQTMTAVGQVYPRSLDLETISVLNLTAAGPSSLAATLRLMAGHGLVAEGAQEGQVGSSAMPHKTNMRTCERINGLGVVLKGHLTMAGGLAGGQWNEGDVSDSVVRRVIFPDAFFACDGLLEATLHVLDGLQVFPDALAAEMEAEEPFLTASGALTAAAAAGMGRQDAHRIISSYTARALAARRSGETYDWREELGNDPDFPLTPRRIREAARRTGTGRAAEQVDAVVAQVGEVIRRSPEAAAYRPEPML